MSYACLLINEKGAVAAAESRLSIHTVFDRLLPRLHLHHDHETKVFSSKQKKVIWAFTGVTTRWFLHYPTMVRLILQNDAFSPEERLELVKKRVCFCTRQFSWVTKFMLLTRQVKSPDDAACSFLYNLMYAWYDEDGTPQSGFLSIKNGKVVTDHRYRGRVFLENGMNMNSLSSPRAHLPQSGESPASLCRKATDRVRESIDRDVELKCSDPCYRITIGGRIRTAMILPPAAKS